MNGGMVAISPNAREATMSETWTDKDRPEPIYPGLPVREPGDSMLGLCPECGSDRVALTDRGGPGGYARRCVRCDATWRGKTGSTSETGGEKTLPRAGDFSKLTGTGAVHFTLGGVMAP